MAKMSDVYVVPLGLARAGTNGRIGRAETFILVTILYIIGYVGHIPSLSPSLLRLVTR